MLAGAELVAFVSATDAGRSRRFYENALGLPCIDETPFACVFRAPNAELRVTLVERLAPAPHTVIGWNVADVEASAHELRANGVEPLIYEGLEQNELGIWRSPSGARVLWFADPDGNVLSLTQR